MRNKIKTAKVHLLKFLCVSPLAMMLLLAFRQQAQHDISLFKNGEEDRFEMDNKAGKERYKREYGLPPSLGLKTSVIDTIRETLTNSKGYFINIKDNKGKCTVVIKDKSKKEVKRLLLTEWNKKEKYYEDLY